MSKTQNKKPATLPIPFEQSLTLGYFEGCAYKYYKSSLDYRDVIFDLRKVQFAGHFPCSLLYSWCASLVKQGVKVSVLIPPAEGLNNQLNKAYLQCGLLSRLKILGVDVPYAFTQHLPQGLPLQTISERDNLWDFIERLSGDLAVLGRLSETSAQVVRDVMNVALFELADNSLVHTNCKSAHFQLTVSDSDYDGGDRKGLIKTFPFGTKYIELSLGDLGPGIDSTLKSRLPDGYVPSLVSKSASIELKLISFAFDFSSTSNNEGRKKRIEELIQGEGIDPDDVATGLFCVLEVVRARRGQLIVRTPNALLSIDFTTDAFTPTLRNHKDLGVRNLGCIPGTHILVRLPLIASGTQDNSKTTVSLHKSALLHSQVSIVAPFKGVHFSKNPSEILHHAGAIIDAHLNQCRHKPGLSIILPAPNDFPSRGLAVFLGMLRSIPHGKRTVFWLDSRVRTIVPNAVEKIISRKDRFKFGGQAVLVGDLTENKLFLPFGAKLSDERGLEVDVGASQARQFKRDVFEFVQKKYTEELGRSLQEILKSPIVRHEPGPFLIEGKYYTNIFYEIPRAVEDIGHTALAADWCMRQILRINKESLPTILVGTCRAMEPILNHLAELLKRYSQKQIKVVCRDSAANSLWGLSALLPYTDERAVIVSDVVCRGRNLNDFLLVTGRLKILSVLAFVDGNESRRTTITVGGDKPYNVPFSAVTHEHIRPHSEIPTSPRIETGEERVYVIDRTTQSPTLYVRHSRPIISVYDQIDTIVQKANALYCGHVESDNKHYAYYLDLERLFSENRSTIENWIQTQIEVVVQAQTDRQPWHVRILNSDGSLDWIRSFFDNHPTKPDFAFIRKENLDAPPPVAKNNSGNWILIVPAIANGETTRRGIEYLSRHSPKSILILCLLSRANPQELDFMLQIRKYGEASLRMAVLFEFSVLAHSPGEDSCPLCAQIAHLKNLLDLVNHSGGTTKLTQALIDKIKSLAVVQMHSIDSGNNTFPILSDGDTARAKLLALYDAAQFSVDSRKQLVGLMLSSVNQMDWFLEMLSQNHRSARFAVSEMQRRLYKGYDSLHTRIRDILINARPPFQLGRTVNAICHISPGLFVEKAADVLMRYASSSRDIEDVCVGLLELRVVPANIGTVLQAIRDSGNLETAGMIADTINYLRNAEMPDLKKAEEQIRSVLNLFAQLHRTSRFSMALGEILALTADTKPGIEKIIPVGERLVMFWREDVLPLISAIQTGDLLDALVTYRDAEALAFDPLERHASQLCELLKYSEIQNPTGFRRRIGDLAKMVQSFSQKIAEQIFSFFIVLGNCSATRLPETIKADCGATIYITKNIDYSIGRAFCDLEGLESIVSELIMNWRKYALNDRRQEAAFTLRQDEAYVVLEFSDNFGGAFNLNSWGGLHTTRSFCAKYCGVFETTDVDANGIKTVRLKFRKFVHPKWAG